MACAKSLRTAFLLIASVWATAAYAGTIFTNFVQPGDLYGPDSAFVGANPFVPQQFRYLATNFTPALDHRLTGLLVPLVVMSGPPEMDVFLLGDSGGLPGGLIESFHVTGLPVASGSTLVAIPSVLQPVLNSGAQYWVAVTGGTQSTSGLWTLTLFTGDSMAGGAFRDILIGLIEFPWALNPGTRVGALTVTGDLVTAPVPEPAAGLLLGPVLAALWYIRRWRR